MSHVIKLTKAERRQLQAVDAELKPWGLSYALERTHHLVAVIAGPLRGGKPIGHWRLLIACTPRDADQAVDHTRQKVRKLIRDINMRLGL